MSLARRKRDRILAAQTIIAAQTIHAVASVRGAALAPAAVASPAAGANTSSPADRAAAQIALRLTHDLRRLKEIRSIDRKIAAKREMLPEYVSWVRGVLEADAGVGTGVAAEVVPTVMVWLIDIAEYFDALALLPFMLRHNVAMPSRYQRDAATIVVEEIAEAALKMQNTSGAFPIEVLLQVSELTDDLDIHDEPRAKLLKAMGIAMLSEAEDLPAAESREALETTMATLRAAQRLNERVGVKDRIKRAEKLLAALTPPAEPNKTEHSGRPAA